ncbi:MAG: thioredoxin-disulfide reductase [Bdellovibrionales bacterium]|nr:thioredoxin-disulfide reductase [Bdellovibrionales bacterium]
MSNTKVEDVVIIGSGPAGYTAAIYSSRANLKPLLFEGEESGGQLMTTTDVENFPGFPEGVMGPDLMEAIGKQASRFGTQILSKNITKVDFSKQPFSVFVKDTEYKANSVIISTGASARYLGLESEKKFLGKGVSACATCDAAFFRDKVVCVIGGGDSAMEEAVFLTRFATKVYILNRGEKLRASKIMADRAIKNEKIKLIMNATMTEVLGSDIVSSITMQNTKTNEKSNLIVDGVFLAIGHTPNTKIFKNQIKLDSTGYIITEPDSTKTSVDGVFACGDVQDTKYRQAITAAGTGCMAALESEKFLESKAH